MSSDAKIVAVIAWALVSLVHCRALIAEPSKRADSIRVAQFNIWELSGEKVDFRDDNGQWAHPQLQSAAAIVAEVDPDVLILNEIDYDPARNLAQLFRERYLDPALPGSGKTSGLTHVVYLPVNTGVPSTMDFNNDGRLDSPEDAWGFGRYPGQYGMAVLSKFPVDDRQIRTFRGLRWITMPGHLMPDGRDGRPAWYSEEESALLRLSSKSHWDVPIEIEGRLLHLLICHPTPPVFDSDEDRNGRRNHDEIRLWADYLSTAPDDKTSYLVDDQGRRGGLGAGELFVVAGDLNADPFSSGPLGPPAIEQLLNHPRVLDPVPRSEGEQPRARRTPYPGESRVRTSTYGRLDYLLPAKELKVTASGVFLPVSDSPRRTWVEGAARASDHQLVWLDISTKGFR